VGKTTSRSTLSHILRHFEKEVFETPKNFNNHWGTPYSLCQMPPNTKYGVFEMGMNHKGEIDSLSALVRPDISLITTVGIAHKANFETVEDIARAKAEIFNHTEKGGIAIINRDIACHPLLEKAAKQNRLQVINFGIHHNADIRLLGYRTHAQGSDFKISVMNHIFEGHVTFPGKHFLFNVLGLIGVTHSLGLDTNRVLKALSQMKPLPGRGAQYTLNWRNNTLHVIDESYNANPLSMEAALNVLGAMQPAPPGRRVVILGDMGELGKETLRAHQDLCTPLMRHKIDCVMTCGPYMRKMKNILPPNMQGPSFDDAEALIRSGLSDLIHNDIVLIKGSNASGLERVVAHLRKS
jgi:UDP-N-acetylmuramoyl-tripeptide--D-alanyl-D-alanine ligase